MRRVIALFAVVLVAVAIGCRPECPDVECPAVEVEIPEQPRVTARADAGSFRVNGQIVRPGQTQEMSPGEVVEEEYRVTIGEDVDGVLGREWLISMAHGLNGGLDEGQLTRLHIDAPGPPEGEEQEEERQGRLYCIGLYSNVASDSAVTSSETYKCIRCGPVTVCGVNPRCEPLQ
jgi:hypothetical protein